MAQRFKMVTGLGGLPELGDVVYDGDKELGEIGFFYYRVDGDTWAVQVHDADGKPVVGVADPVHVSIVDVPNKDGTGVIGRYLSLGDGATGKNIYNADSALGPGATAVVVRNNEPSPE